MITLMMCSMVLWMVVVQPVAKRLNLVLALLYTLGGNVPPTSLLQQLSRRFGMQWVES